MDSLVVIVNRLHELVLHNLQLITTFVPIYHIETADI